MKDRLILIKSSSFDPVNVFSGEIHKVIDYDITDDSVRISSCDYWVLKDEYINIPLELQDEPIETIKLWAAL